MPRLNQYEIEDEMDIVRDITDEELTAAPVKTAPRVRQGEAGHISKLNVSANFTDREPKRLR